MRAVVIGAILASASRALADPGGGLMEKLIGKAFVPAVATPQGASHTSVQPEGLAARGVRAPIAKYAVINPEKEIPHLRGEIFKLEETKHRMKAELERVRSQTAVRSPLAHAQGMPIDAHWKNMIYAFGCIGYGMGGTLLLSIIYKLISRWNHRTPVISRNPLDGEEVQSLAATAPSLFFTKGGLRTPGAAMSWVEQVKLEEEAAAKMKEEKAAKPKALLDTRLDTPAEQRTVAELKELLLAAGLPIGGTKKELVEHVQIWQRSMEPLQNCQDFCWYRLQVDSTEVRRVVRAIRNRRLLEALYVDFFAPVCEFRGSKMPYGDIFMRLPVSEKLGEHLTIIFDEVTKELAKERSQGQWKRKKITKAEELRLLKTGGFPQAVTDKEFLELTRPRRQTVGSDNPNLITIHDFVEVCEGPYKGMQGPVVWRSRADPDELKVLLTILHRDEDTRVSLGRETEVALQERSCTKIPHPGGIMRWEDNEMR